MKFNRQLLFLIAILVVIVLLVAFSNTAFFKPYDSSTVFSHYYPYEGMETISSTAQNISSKQEKEGFKSILGSPIDSEQTLDIFSQIPGSLQCDKTASNLHNSKGGLCLTKQAKDLLSTRGGNLTGQDFQYGSP